MRDEISGLQHTQLLVLDTLERLPELSQARAGSVNAHEIGVSCAGFAVVEGDGHGGGHKAGVLLDVLLVESVEEAGQPGC